MGGTYGDIKLFKLSDSLAPTELATNGYFDRYYGSATPVGYAHPDFTSGGVAYPYVSGGNAYMILAAHGLGDVYQIDPTIVAPQRRRVITAAP